MPENAVTLVAPEGGAGFSYLVGKGMLGILGFFLAFNIRDAAYQIYELLTSRGPFAPGPGFSPIVISIVGAFIGAVSTWSCVQGLTS